MIVNINTRVENSNKLGRELMEFNNNMDIGIYAWNIYVLSIA